MPFMFFVLSSLLAFAMLFITGLWERLHQRTESKAASRGYLKQSASARDQAWIENKRSHME